MGHFGYTVPEAILGEVASTAPSIRRTFVAAERINFGELVQMDDSQPFESRMIKLAVGAITPEEQEFIVGIAVYQPTHPEGYYPVGSSVTVLTRGDIEVKVDAGQVFRAGDLAYIKEKPGLIGLGESDFIFTPEYTGLFPATNTFYWGTFVDGGVATADNFFRVNFDVYRKSFSG